MVIIVRPFGDGAAGMIETEEQAFVQQLSSRIRPLKDSI